MSEERPIPIPIPGHPDDPRVAPEPPAGVEVHHAPDLHPTTSPWSTEYILLYAISGDPDEVAKASRANEILRAGEIALSTQVLQEFYVQATRETPANPITRSQALGLVESFLRFPIVETTAALVLAAAATHDAMWCSRRI